MVNNIDVRVLYRTGKSKKRRKPVLLTVPIGFSYKLLREIIANKLRRRPAGIHIKQVEIVTTTWTLPGTTPGPFFV